MDDLPLPNNALHAAFVLSTRPHAKILSIDSSAAEQVRHAAAALPYMPSMSPPVCGTVASNTEPALARAWSGAGFNKSGQMAFSTFAPCAQAAGVAGFFSAKDVPGDNRIGAVVHDEELFATEVVTCVGQVSRRCPGNADKWQRLPRLRVA